MVYKMVFYAVWVVATFGMFVTRDATFREFCLMQGVFAIGAAHIEILSRILAEIQDSVTIEFEEDETLGMQEGESDDEV